MGYYKNFHHDLYQSFILLHSFSILAALPFAKNNLHHTKYKQRANVFQKQNNKHHNTQQHKPRHQTIQLKQHTPPKNNMSPKKEPFQKQLPITIRGSKGFIATQPNMLLDVHKLYITLGVETRHRHANCVGPSDVTFLHNITRSMNTYIHF